MTARRRMRRVRSAWSERMPSGWRAGGRGRTCIVRGWGAPWGPRSATAIPEPGGVCMRSATAVTQQSRGRPPCNATCKRRARSSARTTLIVSPS
eukprot:5472589-Prymnesium_polylepis.1